MYSVLSGYDEGPDGTSELLAGSEFADRVGARWALARSWRTGPWYEGREARDGVGAPNRGAARAVEESPARQRLRHLIPLSGWGLWCHPAVSLSKGNDRGTRVGGLGELLRRLAGLADLGGLEVLGASA